MTTTNSRWMKWALGGFFTVTALLLGLVLFGDDVRRLFGSSADSLAGQDSVTPRTKTFAATGTDVKKTLSHFGVSSESYDSYGGPAAPQPALAPNGFVSADRDAKSTFAIDVDTASYTYARRQLKAGLRVEPSTVRVEEWVNAFRYDLEGPSSEPWAIHVEGAPSPFTAGRTLLKVSLQGRRVSSEARVPANLVLLVDVSGSMAGDDRLPLAKRAMHQLVDQLDGRDRVALVTYAGSTDVVLPSTSGADKRALHRAIDGLGSGGGTAMGSGMELAFREALAHARAGVASRVMVFTDGDANIGPVGHAAILARVKHAVTEGVMLTTVGVGMGNYRDHELEQLADHGNGQSLYLDGPAEAERVFSQRNLPGLLQVLSKDVKVQVAFDDSVVRRYRLLGYENRDVADADFRNDAVDGGELGAGHTVTALYELELSGRGPLGTVSVRGLEPTTRAPFEVSRRMSADVLAASVNEASPDFRFATAVAMAADVLRGNGAAGVSLREARALAETALGEWPERAEFVELLGRALSSDGSRAQARFESAY
ncbi:MAG: von Willebrand factor type A domain-containing protein [Myxococcaceae bacterium]|nr:von Willebrand factor type A domain-containing protein [Myxococcaceae bacterium]